MTKKELHEWMRTPGFAHAVDALRFLAARRMAQYASNSYPFYLERAHELSASANELVQTFPGRCPRRFGTVKPRQAVSGETKEGT